ncbi:hypothetical protein [Rhodovulum marinum]|nr:hypothetical protein [Rhodovulum marinum]
MSNRIAFALMAMILTALSADFILNNGSAMLFLAQRFVDLIDRLAIWR